MRRDVLLPAAVSLDCSHVVHCRLWLRIVVLDIDVQHQERRVFNFARLKLVPVLLLGREADNLIFLADREVVHFDFEARQ